MKSQSKKIYVSEEIKQAVLEILKDESSWRPPPTQQMAKSLPYSQSSIHKAITVLKQEGVIDSKWRPRKSALTNSV